MRIGSDVCRLFTPVQEFYIWVLKFDNGDLDILLRGSTKTRDFDGGVYYASVDSSVPDYGLPDEGMLQAVPVGLHGGDCWSMITVSTDTSSVTIEWALVALLQHPDILGKAQDELDKHV
ncbi:cytochrome P450 98A8-like [Cryptomeria japonica]|uniref:cytochrome P450 98A8-like n=1 Tax=Cryptomeria japonica TaxID=3369 RepID=UPI0027DAADB1|nr:cytochrome P450 98A8-like [Cryptomeria japonica]